MSKKKLWISFSGGRTSAYMTKWLLDNKQDEYEMFVVFANTGEENEATLQFVHDCDRYFGFNTTWLEADVDPQPRKGTKAKVVTFDTASRKGEPYEDVIRKYGIPNQSHPMCTRELKLQPMRWYIKNVLGWHGDDVYCAVGIRNDETRRISKDKDKNHLIYPLIEWHPCDKQDVNDWWEEQPFNLQLKEHQGNCKWCWKKSNGKLFMVMDENKHYFDFPKKMEELYKNTRAPYGERVFFRGNRSTEDMFALYEETWVKAGKVGSHAYRVNDKDADSGCSESCEIDFDQLLITEDQ